MEKLLARLKEKVLWPAHRDEITPFVFTESSLYFLDQRKLPKEIYFRAKDHLQVRWAIKSMVVRGAPAIGVSGAIGFYLGVKNFSQEVRIKKISKKKVLARLNQIYRSLATARPTAINLYHALQIVKKKAEDFLKQQDEELTKEDLQSLLTLLQEEALAIWDWEVKANLTMAEYGKELLPSGGILTHCNTGALATGGYGTALGVIRAVYAQGKDIFVYVDETRPFFQGTRLTAWELTKLRIPFKVITDNSAGYLMQKGLVQAIVVGADRIAANGDTANKIGTYSLAVLASYHRIPFYVAAPTSTFDLTTPSKEGIPIEERSAKEVLTCAGKFLSPRQAQALNFAFDLTPSPLITAFITEKGVVFPPFTENIKKLFVKSL